MATTLVDDVTRLFQSPDLGEAAAKLGESKSTVTRGFQAASAAILGGLLNRSDEPGFMTQAFDLIKNSFADSRIFEMWRSSSEMPSEVKAEQETGGRFLSTLFGSGQATITEKVSQASGLRFDSAARLMSIAAPAILGMLGKRVREDHLSASNLTDMLQKERTGIASLLPAGLSSFLTSPVASVSSAVNPVLSRVEPTRSSFRWEWLLLAAAALLGLLWLFGSRKPQTTAVIDRTADTVRSATTTATNFVRTKLANGVEISIPTVGLESSLLAELQSGNRTPDPTRWYEFDRLNFDTNAATLQPQSMDQLGNIAAILKANPNVKVKIGGYTDNTGNAQANMTLSQQRADSVRQQLIGMGVGDTRLEAEGYGAQHPVADNATEEGRAKNRRIAMRVTQY